MQLLEVGQKHLTKKKLYSLIFDKNRSEAINMISSQDLKI